VPKNVTISISDDLATKMDAMPEINWSEVCRQAVSRYIEEKEPKQKGELIEGLENYLSGKLPLTEDKERIRKEEIERFRKKWGNPDSISNDEEKSHNYVTLLKTQRINLGNTSVELEIGNSRVQKGFSKYDLNLYSKNLEPVIEYLKSKGFTIAEDNLLQSGVMHYVLKTYGSKGREEWRELASKGYQYFGLFATDKEDCVFIAYREVKPE